ncbi:MAG: hypothetical protein LBS27_03055 [Bifidobacteriaceae bacterium]|nr:hypothetical protein [Bifidobacteriaceae bacterium]
MTARVLITPRSLTARGLAAIPELDPLRWAGLELVAGPPGRQPTKYELLELVPGVIGWIAGVERIDADVIAAAAALKVISRFGVGVDAVDMDAARRRGVAVERAAGANASGVAELALTQILNLNRGVVAASTALGAGEWRRAIGRELAECVVGIVGLGAIGGRLARLVGIVQGPGGRVIGADPAWPVGGPLPPGVAELVPLDRLFALADVVSLHCPPPPDGRPLVGAELLAAMPPGAVLVNTARSGLVDQAALLAALHGGTLAGYAVDAFDHEPPPPSPLLGHPKVLATPHLGGFTKTANQEMLAMAVAGVLRRLEAP